MVFNQANYCETTYQMFMIQKLLTENKVWNLKNLRYGFQLRNFVPEFMTVKVPKKDTAVLFLI